MDPIEKELVREIGLPLVFGNHEVGVHTIHYATVGSGPPLVLIHGLNLGWGQWYPNIAFLANYFTLFLVDLPGAGLSSALSYRDSHLIKDYVETLEIFIADKKLGNVFIAGHSFGGWIALQLVLRGRVAVSRLVLLSPLGFSRYLSPGFYGVSFGSIARFLSRVLVKPTRENLKKIISQPLKKGFRMSENFVHYYCGAVLRRSDTAHPFLFIHRLCSPLRMHPEVLLGDAVERITVPTLMIFGKHDPLVVPEKSLHEASRIPRARIEVCDTGHVPMLENPEETNSIVKDFFLSESI